MYEGGCSYSSRMDVRNKVHLNSDKTKFMMPNDTSHKKKYNKCSS